MPKGVYPRKTKPIEDRFWSKVKKTKRCWFWLGCKNNKGYGAINMDYKKNRRIATHRFSWKLHFGQIPKKMCVLHECDNPACVNPKHLFLGTLADNNRDMIEKGRYNGCAKPGEQHIFTKHSLEEIEKLRKLYKTGKYTQKMLATKFKLSRSSICNIVNLRTWNIIG